MLDHVARQAARIGVESAAGRSPDDEAHCLALVKQLIRATGQGRCQRDPCDRAQLIPKFLDSWHHPAFRQANL